MELPSALRALAHRNFRLFFAGQSVSLIGTWMQQVALAWEVFRLTGSAWWLGMAGFAAQILILLTQTVAMIQAFLVAMLALTGLIELWHIMALSVLLGVVNAFDMPARQAFMVEMVTDHAGLTNAIALNSSIVNAARLVGPALAGLILAQTGAGVCFLINGISYVAVLIALLAMEVPKPAAPRPRVPIVAGLREGFTYAWRFSPVRSLLLLVAIVSLLGMSYSVLLPVFATDMLEGGADTLGLLYASAGVGALTAAIMLARRSTILGLGRWIAAMPALFGVALIAFSFSRLLPLSVGLLAVAGFAVMMQLAASNTLLQTIVDEDKRGRVMSLYAMAFLGMSPFGSLLAGALADRFGATTMLMISGACCIAGAAAFALRLNAIREQIRPIYRRKGILPEVAVGLQTASEMSVPGAGVNLPPEQTLPAEETPSRQGLGEQRATTDHTDNHG
jgi:MFS family permease